MGDYSVHCCLSGLPISSGMPVVGWKLQKSKFKNDIRFPYIPLSFPVHGYYDSYGGMRTKEWDGNSLFDSHELAMCHECFWNELPKFWNPEDGTTQMYNTLVRAHDNYLRSRKLHLEVKSNRLRWDPLREADSALHGAVGNTSCFGRWIQDLYLGEPAKNDKVSPAVSRHWGYDNCSGAFEKMFLSLIIDGYPNPVLCADLEKLVMTYFSVYFRGHPVLPVTHTHPEQYPNYERETQWFTLVLSKSLELLSKELQARKEHELEDQAEHAKNVR